MRIYFQDRLKRQLNCDPADPKALPAQAVLTSEFLEAIVRHPGYLQIVEDQNIEMNGYLHLLPDRGLEIFCARFRRPVSLENARLNKPLVIGASRFDQRVNLRRFSSDSFVVFFGTVFQAPVQAYAIAVEGDMLLQGGTRFLGGLNVIGAHIGGNFVIKGSEVQGTLQAENVFVGGSLRLHEGSRFGAIDLCRARIGNVLDTSEASFTGKFLADAVEIGGFAHFRRGATFQDVSMISAKVRGSMDTVGGFFNGTFSAYDIEIGGSLFLRGGATFHDVNLSNAVIGGSLELRGSEYRGRVDLTNARIVHELQVATPLPKEMQTEVRKNYDPPKWGDEAELVLRNLHAEALQDTAEAWDNLDGRLDLVGFTYQQLGGLRSTRDSIMAARDPEWMLAWLRQQRDRDTAFQPQPYEQLAKVLRDGGWIRTAEKILMARFNYQMTHDTTPWSTKAWLFVKWAVIGHGLEVWISILWLLGLGFIGMIVMHDTTLGRTLGWGRCLFYSFDASMPFVDLNPRVHTELSERAPQGTKIYFAFHRITGLTLVTFLAAGMSGLAQ